MLADQHGLSAGRSCIRTRSIAIAGVDTAACIPTNVPRCDTRVRQVVAGRADALLIADPPLLRAGCVLVAVARVLLAPGAHCEESNGAAQPCAIHSHRPPSLYVSLHQHRSTPAMVAKEWG